MCVSDTFLINAFIRDVYYIFASQQRAINSLCVWWQITLTGWFAFDFKLSELKTLRKRQPLEFRDHKFDGKYTIPTLEEYIGVAKAAPRRVGIYPELKNPAIINTLPSLR